MTTPTNVKELRRAIDAAWDDYEGALRDGLRALDPPRELGGLAAAHELLGQAAEDAYTAFKVEQKRINAAYGSYVDAPYLEKDAREDYTRAVHNAHALVEAADYRYQQHHDHLEKIRAGEFAKYGTEEPSESELSQEAELLAALKSAKEEAPLAVIRAQAKRDAELAGLKELRPGVTSGDAVDEPEPALPDKAREGERKAGASRRAGYGTQYDSGAEDAQPKSARAADSNDYEPTADEIEYALELTGYPVAPAQAEDPNADDSDDADDEALDIAEYNASVAHLTDAELNRGEWQPGDPEGPEPRTQDEWDYRAEIMRLAVLSFPGKRDGIGRPPTEALRAYSGVADIKHKERTEVWRNAGSPVAPVALQKSWQETWDNRGSE